MSTAVERILGEVMDGLVACLCAKLADSHHGSPCFCSLVGGREAIADHCSCDAGQKCGMAWVRLDRVYAYATDLATPARVPSCTSPLAAVLEVGVYRCIPTMKGDGTPPGVLEQTNQTLGQVSDMGAMVAAVQCCEPLTTRSHVLGTYLPRDSGDCGGGILPVTVALSQPPPAGQRGGARRS